VFIIEKHFYWSKLRQDFNKYIISFTTYVISKPNIKKKRLYTLLPTPERPLESFSMDYISSLLFTKHNNDCVFVVVDQFFKMAIITSCKKRITVADIDNIFLEWVWINFWIPCTITSDWDNRFFIAF
jgi:hypothetical protein